MVLGHASVVLRRLRRRSHLWLRVWRHLVVDIISRVLRLGALADGLDIGRLIHILVVRVVNLAVSLLVLNSRG